MQNQCFFIGHSNTPATVYPKLRAEIESLVIHHDVRQFIVGHYGAFDHICATAVADVKRNHPDVKLTMLLPYHPATHPIQPTPSFDDTVYPFERNTVPPHAAIVSANKHMVDQSQYLIAYVKYAGSNSREILEYAMKREVKGLIHITNLADTE